MPPTAVSEFQAALAELSTRSGVAVDKLLGNIGRLSPAEARSFITDAYPELLTPYLAASGQLTAQWYAEQPVGERKPGSKIYTPEPAPLAPAGQLAISGRWALTQGDPATALRGSAGRAVMNASRDTVTYNARSEGVRWIRKARSNACGFCKMLATRSVTDFNLYTSREAAERVVGTERRNRGVIVGRTGGRRGKRKLGDKYHDHCFCIGVALRDGKPYQPTPQEERWTKQYYDIVEGDAVVKGGLGTSNPALISKLLDDGRVRPDRIKDLPAAPLAPVATAPAEPQPVNLDEPLPDLRRKADPNWEPLTDISAVNPNWKQSYEWNVNCTRCSLTVELRHRGYDVTAEPKPKALKDNYDRDILARFQSGDGVVAGTGGLTRGRPLAGEVIGMGEKAGARYFHILPKGRKQAKQAADEAAQSWGDGGRGYVVVTWKGRRSSHIFNVENRDGQVIYTDGQSAEIDASAHFDTISTSENSAQIVRTDDLDLVPDKVTPWVRSRTDADIGSDAQRTAAVEARVTAEQQAKADATARAKQARLAARKIQKGPSTQEYQQAWDKYVADLKDLGVPAPPDLFDDFFNGARRARASGGSIDATDYSSDPAKADAYQSGWFWYRKWTAALLTP